MRNDATRNLSARSNRLEPEHRNEPGERESGLRTCPPKPHGTDPPAPNARQLGSYELLGSIGSGAMGRVYRARHVLLGRLVAIKVLRPELAADDAHVERFVAEARSVNLLQHPNVIDVMDIAVARDARHAPWFVMELLDGADVATIATQGRLPLTRVLRIMRQVCEALDAVHAAGIVHRDVKPENIFITQRDGGDFVKLIDFGVARLREPHRAVALHGVGQLVGTPHYMAPEQVSDVQIDHRADLYAVGAVLFELIAGAPPLDASDLRSLLAAVLLTPAPPVSSRVELPLGARADIDELVGRCLEKQPCDRPASAREVIAALDRIADRVTSGPSRPLRYPLAGPSGASDDRIPTMISWTPVTDLVRPRTRSVRRWISAMGAAATLSFGMPVPLSESATMTAPAQVSQPPATERPALQLELFAPAIVTASASESERELDRVAIADERQAHIDRRRMRARMRSELDPRGSPASPILVLTPVKEPAAAEGLPSEPEGSGSLPPVILLTQTNGPALDPEGAPTAP